MQDVELRVPEILRYAARRHGGLNLFSLDEDGTARYQSYAETQARVQKLTGALEALDLPPQSRIASLALNTRRHLELYYGVTAAGHILHTINPRFTTEQILFSVRQAETDLLFFDPAFAAQAEAIAADRPQMRACIVLGEPEKTPAQSSPTLSDYESFFADGTPSDGPAGLSAQMNRPPGHEPFVGRPTKPPGVHIGWGPEAPPMGLGGGNWVPWRLWAP